MAEFNKAYYRRQGKAEGIALERERIIKLLEAEQLHDPDVTECHCGSWREAVALIKDEARNITSEILPDGTIYIEEIKGEK